MFREAVDRIASPFQDGIEISYSRINTYATCPFKYKLIYSDGWHVPPNPFISLGLSIHRALEAFHAGGYTSLDDLLDGYNDLWVNEGFLAPQQAHEFYEKGQTMLENYWRESRSSESQIVCVEKEFSFPVGRNRLRGIIDRIDRLPDGTYELIDYKTHVHLWTQEKVDTDLQLSLYALACSRILNVEPDVLSYYFLAHNRKMKTSRTHGQIEQAVKTVAETAEKIIREDFSPDRTHCHRCDFRTSCPRSAEAGSKRSS